MGMYINKIGGNSIGSDFDSKVASLKAHGATVITAPMLWHEGIICVVDNIMFAAAGYAYCQEELEAFQYPGGRRRLWMHHPDAKEWVD